MTRFSIDVNDELAIEFRIQAVKHRMKLNEAFTEAMKLWLYQTKPKAVQSNKTTS
jgi:hypothetical protein